MATYSLKRAHYAPTYRGAYDPDGDGGRAAAPLPSRALHPGDLGAVAKGALRSTQQLLVNATRRARWLRARPRAIAAYLAGHSVRKLHLGCGPITLAGWLNADVRPRQPEHIFIDARERLPFADASLDYIFSEHMIGDLTYAQTATLLSECHRVLRPGGRLRIATPNLTRFAEMYSPNPSDVHRRFVAWAVGEFMDWADAPLPGLVINNLFQDHRFVYDPATLGHVFARAGFIDVTEARYGESADPNLAGLDSHGRLIGHPDLGAFESVTLEATRA